MSARRGLTLVEVLAAVVLLAMLAAAVVPLLRDVAGLSADAPVDRSAARAVLAAASEAIIAQPSLFALPDFATMPPDQIAEASIPPGMDIPPPLRVTRLAAQDEEADHAWIIFEHGGVRIARSVWLPMKERRAGS